MARPDRHRDQIVAAAAASLQRVGYAASSVTEILDQAHATNGSLYHHFPGGKRELAAAALEQSAALVDSRLRQALTRAGDPKVAIEAWIDVLTLQLQNDPRQGCPIAPTAAEATAIGDDLRHAAAAAFRRWTTTLATALGGTPEAAQTARAVMSAIEGALLLDRTAGTVHHLAAIRAALPGLIGGGAELSDLR